MCYFILLQLDQVQLDQECSLFLTVLFNDDDDDDDITFVNKP